MWPGGARRVGRALVCLASLPLVVLSAACASTSIPTVARSTTTSGSGSSSSLPASTTTPGARSVSFRLYFMRGDKIAVTARTVVASPTVAAAALRTLLAGPNATETGSGLFSDIPSGTRLRGVLISDGTATVDLSSNFESGGASLSMTARLAQVTYTLTQFPTVSGVLYRLDGRPITVFGGEGVVLDRPATRSSFESVTPAVLVEAPTPGCRVTSSLSVWGTANVFEATFQVEVAPEDGHVLVSQVVHATSGTGTRGSFNAMVAIPAAAGPVTLKVFDLSAKDGSRQDLVVIPLRLG